MLVAVIMIFVVFSFTGVAVLDVAYNSRAASIETVNNIRVQYVVESAVNEALWLINSGKDSLVNRTADGITSNWNGETEVLTISVDTLDTVSEITLDLTSDTHFERGLASKSGIGSNGYTYGNSDEHAARKFDFMPDVDAAYFATNAIRTENGNERSWNSSDFTDEGIYVFNGNNLTIDGVNLTNSTMVFTGSNITFINCILTAPLPGEGSAPLPALLITDPNANFTVASSNHIEGAIFCAGQINLQDATLTGPVVGEFISLEDNITLMDSGNDAYYTWTVGFGEEDSYDWPKQVGRWTNTKWESSTNG